jgi:hypothetical protein
MKILRTLPFNHYFARQKVEVQAFNFWQLIFLNYNLVMRDYVEISIVTSTD